MSFDLMEYRYQLKTGKEHSPGWYEGKAAQMRQNPDYMTENQREKGISQGVQQAEDKQFDDWNKASQSFFTGINTDSNNREHTYQKADEFGRYRDTKTAEIDSFVNQASGLKDYYIRNKEYYDDAYGIGTTDKILKGIDARIDGFNKVKAGLNDEYDFWGKFNDENDYNQKKAEAERFQDLSTRDLDKAKKVLDIADSKVGMLSTKMLTSFWENDPSDMAQRTEEAYRTGNIAEAERLRRAYEDPETFKKEEISRLSPELKTAKEEQAYLQEDYDAAWETQIYIKPLEEIDALIEAAWAEGDTETKEKLRNVRSKKIAAKYVIPDNIADIDAAIATAQEEFETLQKQMGEADREAAFMVNEETGETDPEYEKTVEKFLDLRQQCNDTEAWLKQLKSERPYVKDAGIRKEIEKQAMSDPDFLKKAGEGNTVYNTNSSDEYELLMTMINANSTAPTRELQMRIVEIEPIEREVLQYLYASGMKKEFKTYYNALFDLELDKRNAMRDADAIREVADSGWFGKFSTGAYSFLANLATPVTLIESAKSMITGEPINKYSSLMQPAYLAQVAREASLKDASDVGKWWGNLFFSMGDVALTLPFGPAGSLAIMTSRAAGQAAYDIAQRGGTGAEAFFGGLAAGATEYFTEKIPIDRLFNIAKSGVKFFSKQGLINVLKQVGVEASEEWVSEVLNNFTDLAIMGDRSNLGFKIRELMAQGMSEQEARQNAFTEFFVWNPLKAAAGGAISGGVFGAGANAVSNIRTNLNQSTLQNPSVINMKSAGLNSLVNQQAGRLQNIQAKNGEVTQLSLKKADPNAVSAKEVQSSIKNAAEETKTLAEEIQADLYNDDVKNAYNKFRLDPTNTNAEAFYNALIQNIDTAIAAEQQAGADTSALAELKGKMESAKSEAAQALPDTAQAARADVEQKMIKAVSALTNLPAGVQAQADAYAARQALYDYMKADESDKATAYSKATDQLKESISAALETEGLDAGTRQTLEEMLDNIDSGGEMGDNIIKSSADIEKVASKFKTEKDTAYFWSGNSNGIGGKDYAREYAKKNGGTTLENLMESKGIKMPIWDISNQDSIKAWDYASEIYAREASGVIKSIVGKSIRPNSVWEKIELKTLKANPNVTKVIVIDPETLVETVIFWR